MTHPSPGSSATIAANILAWLRAHQGQVPYDEENYATRLKSDTLADLLTPTDCSGLTAKIFKFFAGLTVGTFTGDECFYGKQITTSKAQAASGIGMRPCDVILFNWPSGRSTWDHIAIYAGNGRIWNHGGPGHGPLDWSLASNVNAAINVMVRRYLPWDSDTTSPPSTDLLEQIMALDRTSQDYKDLVADIAKAVWTIDGVIPNPLADPASQKRNPFWWPATFIQKIYQHQHGIEGQ